MGTIFSMAVLAFVSSLVLQLTLRVAAALWTSNAINNITGNGAEGLSNQALQQGGLGLLMTVLIISVPPMAAMFFQGTVGNFLHYSAFAGPASAPGPQGRPPGSYTYAPPSPNPGPSAAAYTTSNPGVSPYRAVVATAAATDSIKSPAPGRNLP